LGLSEDKRFKLGLVLDAWLFPLRDEEITDAVTQPLLFINTGMFDTFL
jgi:platelet-activating factor acetylhydrolase